MMRLNSRTAVGCLSAIFLTLAGLPGCGGNGGGNGNPDMGMPVDTGPGIDMFVGSATLTMTPATQNFGDVVIGQTSTATTFTVMNTGTAPSSALTVSLSGGSAADFSIGANTCAGMTLATGAMCTVSVTFNPSGGSPRSSSATLTAMGGTASASSALSGRAVADVGFTVSPTPFSFGTTAVGTPTTAHSFTVTNTGGVASGMLSVSLGGLDATQFTIGTDDCTGMTLPAAGTCTIDVTYSPTSAGDHAAMLSVAASPGGTANAAITGRAQVPAALLMVPSSRNFGSVVSGSMSTSVDFQVRNTGGVATSNITAALSGADASEFAIVSDLCSGAPLAGGATCTISVQFTAGTAGAKTATLTATAGALSAMATLTATSSPLGAITITPATHDFGRSTVGTATGGTTFTVTNTGGSTIGPMVVGVAGTNPTDFPIGSNTCAGTMLTAGGTCTVAVSFNPSAIGARDATLTANGTGASGAGSAALTGIGDTAPMIVVTPTAANFGSVATGTSLDLPFTVTNMGTATTGAIMAVVTGVSATQFSVVSVGTCSAPLAGGAMCTVTVRYSPTATGAVTAVLNVSSPVGGSDTSDLSGTGITPAALTFDSGSPVTFGNVAETDTPTRSVVVRNTGAAMVSGLTATLSGADAGSFTILPSSTCGATLAGASTCQIDIRINAHAVRAYAASLDVSGTPGGMISAPISATGIADILITCNPDLAFGNATIGAAAVTRPCTFLNQTTRVLTLSALPAVSAGTGFTAAAGTCTASSMLAAGTGSCTMNVSFLPTGMFGARTATLSAAASGGAMDSVTVTGTALAPLRFVAWDVGGGPQATFPAAFGDRAIGGIYQVVVTAQNFASVATSAVQTSAAFTGNPDMSIVGDTCSGTLIASGAQCSVTVRYFPRTTGAAGGSVTLTTAGGNTSTAMITANGIIGASISVTGSGAFGNVVATRTLDRTFTVTNNSPSVPTAALSFSLSGSGRYSLVTGAGGGTCPTVAAPLAASASCTIVVRFSPSQIDTVGVDITGNLAVQQGAQVVNNALTGRATSQITISPTTANFQTGVGTTSATQTFTITNVGGVSTGSIVVAAGSFGTEFPITNNTCSTLASGATCTVDVAFAPTANVDRMGVELRASNGGYVAGVARVAVATLNGDAASQAALAVTPSSSPGATNPEFMAPPYPKVYFGAVVEGTNSANSVITITNTGDLPTTSAPTFVLDDSSCPFGPGSCMATANFDVVSNTCTAPLAGGASCTATLRFSPPVGTSGGVGTGTWQYGSLHIVAGAAAVYSYLQGLSLNATSITVTPQPSDFGAIAAGTTVGPRSFMVGNNTGGNVTLGNIVTNNAQYTIAPGTCTNGSMLAAGATCTFTATFAPPAVGPYGRQQAIITVNITAGFSFPGWLYVDGTSLAPAGLSVSPSSFAYPTTVSGTTSPRTFTVTNTGDVPTSVAPSAAVSGADPSQFVIANNNCTAVLAGHASCTLDVNFAPTGAGARSATLTVSAGALSASSTLTGSGVAAALLGISPSAPQACPGTTDYAGTGASASFMCVTYTISNGGGSSTNVTAAITGDFAVDPTSTCVTTPTLGVGGTCTVIVRHTPSDVGADMGTLTVSAPGITSVTGTVSATGVAALTVAGTATFGSLMVGAMYGAGNTQTFTFTNQTNPSTGILTAGVTGTAAADFDVTGDTCTGGTLAQGATCTITVRFTPSATGTRTASLLLTDGTPNKTATVSLSGTGT